MATVVRELLTKWGFEVDDKQLKKFGKSLSNAKKTAQNVSIAVGGALASMAIPAMSLEDNIAKALTISGIQVKDFEKNRDQLTKLAMDLGDDLGLSAKQVSETYYGVLSTGAKLSGKAFEEMTRTSLKFAKVGFIETATAVEYLDGTIKAFNLDASEAGNVADVLQSTSFKASINIAQLTESIKTAAPIASGLGISLEETSAIIAGMGEKFVKGGEAGNAFKRILTRIKDGGGPASETLKKLGIQAFDSQGNFTGFINVLEQLQDKTKDLTQQQRTQALLDIAGQYGEAPLTALLQQDMNKFKDWKSELMNSTGAVDKAMAILKKRASDVGSSFVNAGKNILILFGMQLLDILKPILSRMTKLLILIKDFVEEHKTFAKITTAIMSMVFAVSSLTWAFTLLLPKIMAFKLATLKTFAILAVKIALVIAVMLALYLIIEDIFGFFTGKESVLGEGFTFYLDKVKMLIRDLKVQWVVFKFWIKGLWRDIGDYMTEAITNAFTPVKDFFQKLLPYQNKAKLSAKIDSANTRNSGYANVNSSSPGKVQINMPTTITVPEGVNAEDTQNNLKSTVKETFQKELLKANFNFQPVIEG